MPFPAVVGDTFDPAMFLATVQSGALDGRLHQELAKLIRDQLEEVAKQLIEQQAAKP